MNKFLRTIIMVLLPLSTMGALTVNNGGGATNITSTSAWITATVASTGAANPYLYSYWGTNDGSTNASSWKNTNSFGVCTQATYSFQATGLAGSKIYYYRAYATNGTQTNWASYSAQFITLTTPTSAPPSSTQAVTVDTNDGLKHPGTNFWVTNKVAILAGIGLSGALTNEASWVAASNTVVYTNTPAYTNAVALASAAYLSSNPSNFVDRAGATNGMQVAGNYATGTPVYVETDSIATNLIAALSNQVQGITNGAALGETAVQPITLAAHTTNQLNPHAVTAEQVGATPTNTIVAQGVIYTITNAAQTGYILEFNPANSTAWFVAKSGAGTYDHTALTNENGNTNYLHVTQVQSDAIETNLLAFHGRTNINIIEDGTNIYFDYTGTNIVLGTSSTDAYRGDWGASISSQVSSLNGSTASLNTAVGNLNSATGSLNTSVGNLITATGSLNTAVGNLNSATGSLNTSVGNLNGATNSLNTRMGNAETATNALNTRAGNLETATNAINAVANAALPKAGGTMTGPLTNNVAYWLPTNGVIYFGGTNIFIQGQGGTNFLFVAGTNSANFGW